MCPCASHVLIVPFRPFAFLQMTRTAHKKTRRPAEGRRAFCKSVEGSGTDQIHERGEATIYAATSRRHWPGGSSMVTPPLSNHESTKNECWCITVPISFARFFGVFLEDAKYFFDFCSASADRIGGAGRRTKVLKGLSGHKGQRAWSITSFLSLSSFHVHALFSGRTTPSHRRELTDAIG